METYHRYHIRDSEEKLNAIFENVRGWITEIKLKEIWSTSGFVDTLNFVRLARVAIYFGHPVEKHSPRGCLEKFAIKHLRRFSSTIQSGGARRVECIVILSLTAAAGVRKQARTSGFSAECVRKPVDSRRTFTTAPNRPNLHARLSVNTLSFPRRKKAYATPNMQRHSRKRSRHDVIL